MLPALFKYFDNCSGLFQRWTRLYIELSCKLIEKKLRLGYDIGKGYVNSQDDVYMSVNDAVEDDYQAEKIKSLLKDAKTRMMHELGKTLTQPRVFIRFFQFS